MTDKTYYEGGCSCGEIRYRLTNEPLIVHCCHCSWCQRESGSAFAINALIENDHLQLLSGEVHIVKTPTASGRGQKIARCPICQVALWSHYSGSGKISFIRVGTLFQPHKISPDIHIYTLTKLPWIRLPDEAVSVKKFYSMKRVWSEQSLLRLERLRNQTKKR